ncbi:VacJ family lipoprotein [Paraburkholderia phosphatilytica]|uniref:MlaA family lipoprotein n=1 Tax=Paraburkholderia phosphatilytica TaxID=2282883 RepID=UPI000E541697|nr:VacJ family lipoprotein [Paraburkholderia phosphatilytica]
MKMRIAPLALVAAGLMSGCATGPNRTPGDPLEPMNRTIYKFNDALDRTVAKPIAKGYQKVTPQPVRTAVDNFFSNIGDLDNFANNLLQLKITDATEDLMRVAMNTVFGIGGLIDFATPAGLPKHKQDFGLTLGRWGMPSGPYLVLPFFGPSSFRDATGLAVDVRFNPMNYLDNSASYPLWALQFISARADMLGATDLLQTAALDPYSFVRDAYTQQRRARLQQGSTTNNNNVPLPNYGDPGAATPGSTTPAPGGANGSHEPSGSSNGLPNYTDPGDSGAAPAGSTSNGLPNYTDPGASSPSPASAAGTAGK